MNPIDCRIYFPLAVAKDSLFLNHFSPNSWLIVVLFFLFTTRVHIVLHLHADLLLLVCYLCVFVTLHADFIYVLFVALSGPCVLLLGVINGSSHSRFTCSQPL